MPAAANSWRLLRLTNETIKERMEALEGAFSVSSEHTKGKKLSPFDDLYGSPYISVTLTTK